MVRRYAHLTAEHVARYAGNTEGYTAESRNTESHGTITAQPPDFAAQPDYNWLEFCGGQGRNRIQRDFGHIRGAS
jgi:hypothetical protein